MITLLRKRWKTVLFLFLVGVIVFLLFKNKSQSTKIYNLKAENTALNQSIDTFRNKNHKQIVEQTVAVYENREKVKELSKEIFNLKKANERLVKDVNYFGSIAQKIKIDSIFIAYTDTTNINILDSTLIRVPKSFSTNTENYSMSGVVLKKGLSVDSINIPNVVSYREFEKRQGWFKQPVTTVQVVNSNPYITTVGLTTVSVKHKTSAWHKWIKPTLVGLGASFITYKIVK